MGGAIVRLLLQAGSSVTIFDLDAGRLAPLQNLGAQVATSAREVADAAEVVFGSLPSQETSRTVALEDGGISGGKKIKIYIETSTIGPPQMAEIASVLEARGIAVLDCPVSGGPKGAEAGTIAVMAAGAKTTFDRAEPMLRRFAKKVFYVGEKPGQAQTCKLLNNIISYAGAAIAYEAVVLGVKAGLDAATLVDVINASTGRNRTTEEKFAKSIFPRTFDFGGPLFVNLKDIKLYLDLADEMQMPALIGSSVAQLWRIAATQGLGRRDSTSVIQCIEQWAGVEVKGDEAG
jgi:3-hydroxyisobutyrate dehydrogenase-like beta-hydroxyacid dehydrogenase